jgi:hypothetical protein
LRLSSNLLTQSDLDFPREVLVNPLQEHREAVRRQQLHLLCGIDIEHGGDEIGDFTVRQY